MIYLEYVFNRATFESFIPQIEVWLVAGLHPVHRVAFNSCKGQAGYSQFIDKSADEFNKLIYGNWSTDYQKYTHDVQPKPISNMSESEFQTCQKKSGPKPKPKDWTKIEFDWDGSLLCAWRETPLNSENPKTQARDLLRAAYIVATQPKLMQREANTLFVTLKDAAAKSVQKGIMKLRNRIFPEHIPAKPDQATLKANNAAQEEEDQGAKDTDPSGGSSASNRPTSGSDIQDEVVPNRTSKNKRKSRSPNESDDESVTDDARGTKGTSVTKAMMAELTRKPNERPVLYVQPEQGIYLSLTNDSIISLAGRRATPKPHHVSCIVGEMDLYLWIVIGLRIWSGERETQTFTCLEASGVKK